MAILPILAAVCYAGIHMLSRRMGGTERASTLSIYIQLVFLVVCLTMGALFGSGHLAPGDMPSYDFRFNSMADMVAAHRAEMAAG